MSLAFVTGNASKSADGTNVSTETTAAFTNPNTVGNWLFAIVHCKNGTGTTPVINAGGVVSNGSTPDAFTQVGSWASLNNSGTYFFHALFKCQIAHLAGSGNLTVQATTTVQQGTFLVNAIEFTGVDPSTPLDTASQTSASSLSTATVSIPSVTVTNSGEILLVFVTNASASSTTAGSGYAIETFTTSSGMGGVLLISTGSISTGSQTVAPATAGSALWLATVIGVNPGLPVPLGASTAKETVTSSATLGDAILLGSSIGKETVSSAGTLTALAQKIPLGASTGKETVSSAAILSTQLQKIALGASTGKETVTSAGVLGAITPISLGASIAKSTVTSFATLTTTTPPTPVLSGIDGWPGTFIGGGW